MSFLSVLVWFILTVLSVLLFYSLSSKMWRTLVSACLQSAVYKKLANMVTLFPLKALMNAVFSLRSLHIFGAQLTTFIAFLFMTLRLKCPMRHLSIDCLIMERLRSFTGVLILVMEIFKPTYVPLKWLFVINYLHFSGSADALFDSGTEIKSLPVGNVIQLVMKPNPVQLKFVSTVKNTGMKLLTVLKSSNAVFVRILAILHLILPLHGTVKILTIAMSLNLFAPVQPYRLMQLMFTTLNLCQTMLMFWNLLLHKSCLDLPSPPLLDLLCLLHNLLMTTMIMMMMTTPWIKRLNLM